MIIAQRRIALEDALRVKSAELWLKLGEPMAALQELERLAQSARRHPWAIQVFFSAFGAFRAPEFWSELQR